MRRAIGIHMVPELARFRDRAGGYIYRRYERTGDRETPELARLQSGSIDASIFDRRAFC